MIPVNQPLITKQYAIAVFKSVKSGWVSSAGPQIQLFENKFKKTIWFYNYILNACFQSKDS